MMATQTMREHIAIVWSIIRDMDRLGALWPQCNLLDGIRRLECRIEGDTMFAVFSCLNRHLTAGEEREMVDACEVPAGAERVPGIGQDRIWAFRPGIYGTWYSQIVFRWTEIAHG